MARYIERTLLVLSLIVMFIGSTMAHTYLSSIIIGDQALNEGDCMRPHPDQEKEYPLLSVTDQDMTCGWLPSASRPANRKCPIVAGSKVGLQWYHTQPIASDFIIADTHKGPVMVYLAKSETGAGPVWFKIYEDGYDPITQKWATDKLIANRGKVFFNIPADIAPGNYLMRGEVLALHNAGEVYGIQPYVGCAEITISGSGSATPQGVAFPGAYTPTGPGMLFDVYNYYNSYTIPGPSIYRASSTPSTQAPSTPTARPTSAPYSAPTERPSTTAPNGIKLKLNEGSNTWWIGVKIQDSKQPISKVEIMDNNALSSWTPLVDMSWAYVFSQSVQVSTPISVRLTAVNGQQIVFYNVFTSFDSSNFINTGKNF